MIIVMKRDAKAKQVQEMIHLVESRRLNAVMIEGQERNVIGVTGDTTQIDIRDIRAYGSVSEVLRVSQPYKLANRAFHPHDSLIQVRDQIVGGEQLAIIAGPCSVESEEQLIGTAKRVKAAGANMLRGGAYKPRTSPYSFQGLEEEGLRLLALARRETGLPVVSELMSIEHIEPMVESVDVIQIGARNMQNFPLLKEVGKTDTPVILKRGLTATYEEWLMAAEYIMSEGNKQVMLCERGIRTYETETRNTLDIQAVPVMQKKTHLPIIMDPAHAAGKVDLIPAGARASIAAGADGIMVEVHPEPEKAWSDGEQSLTPDEFDRLMEEVQKMAQVMDKSVPVALTSGH